MKRLRSSSTTPDPTLDPPHRIFALSNLPTLPIKVKLDFLRREVEPDVFYVLQLLWHSLVVVSKPREKTTVLSNQCSQLGGSMTYDHTNDFDKDFDNHFDADDGQKPMV